MFRRKLKGSATLQTVIAAMLFSMLSISIVTLLHSELKELTVDQGLLEREISQTRLENVFNDFLAPYLKWKKHEDGGDIFTEKNKTDSIEISEEGEILRVGSREILLQGGAILSKEGFARQILWSKSEKPKSESPVLTRLNFTKQGTRLSVAINYLQNENKRQMKLDYLLAHE